MTFDQIAALPVQKLAAKNCRLFMWATWPQLPHAIGVMRAWGFPYSTAPILWIKPNRWALDGPVYLTDPSIWWSSKGKWTRTNSEVVLSGKRGKLARRTENMPQIVVAPRGRHSEKPEEVARVESSAWSAGRIWKCSAAGADGDGASSATTPIFSNRRTNERPSAARRAHRRSHRAGTPDRLLELRRPAPGSGL